MKYLIIFSLLIANISSIQGQTFFQKHGSVSSDVTGSDVDFNRATTDVTISVAGNYLIMISAQGTTQSINGDPFKCHHRDGIVKVWSRTRNLELARTPFNYIFADQNSQSNGNPPGLVQKTFPFYNIMIVQLNAGEVIGLKASVIKQCPANTALGKWNVFDARVKIVKL